VCVCVYIYIYIYISFAVRAAVLNYARAIQSWLHVVEECIFVGCDVV
jgi:hypothetical protein